MTSHVGKDVEISINFLTEPARFSLTPRILRGFSTKIFCFVLEEGSAVQCIQLARASAAAVRTSICDVTADVTAGGGL